MKLYHCSNLEQIAAMFDNNANEARNKEASQHTQKDKSKYRIEHNIWVMAATIIRNTEMHDTHDTK